MTVLRLVTFVGCALLLYAVPPPQPPTLTDVTVVEGEGDDGSDADSIISDTDSDVGDPDTESEVEYVDEEPALYPSTRAIGSFKITAYCLRGITRAGTYTTYGTAATDRQVIPAYTRFIIEDMGEYISLDTGSAVIGRHIDVWMDSCATARQWGVRYRNVEIIQ